jgi:hypothetical protein
MCRRRRASPSQPRGEFDMANYLVALEGRPASVDFVDRLIGNRALRLLYSSAELRIGLNTGGILVINCRMICFWGRWAFPSALPAASLAR